MINTNEHNALISSLTIKFAMIAFIFLVGAIYFNTLSPTIEKMLLGMLVVITLFTILFLIFRKEFLRYDTMLNEQIYANTFYKTVVVNSPLSLIVTDGNQITYHNIAARKLFNKNKWFFETATVYDLIHPEDRHKLEEIIQTSSSVDNLILRINKETIFCSKDITEYQYVNFSVQRQPFSDKDRFVIFAYNITEYYTEIDKIREHLSVLESLINASPRAITIYDAEGKLYFQTLQAKLQQIAGSDGSFASAIEYDINRNLLNTGFQMALSGYSYSDDKIIERKTDYNKWAKIAFTPIVSAKGHKYVRYAIDDITHYKRQITDNERQLYLDAMMLNNSKLAAVIWDADGYFVRANKEFYNLFRLKQGIFGNTINLFREDSIIPQTINEVVFNHNDPTKRVVYKKKNIRHGFKKYFENFQKCEPFEILMNIDISRFIKVDIDSNEDEDFDDTKVDLDGSNIWMRNFSYPLYDETNKLFGYASEFYNVTDYFVLLSKFNINKTYLEAIANNFSAGIILIINENSEVVFLGGENDIIKKLHAMGYNPARQIFDFADVPEFDVFSRNVLDALKNKTSKTSSHRMFNNSYDIQFLPIISSNHKVEHCLVIGFDVADRENYEKQLIDQKHFLEKTFSESTIPTIVIDTTGKYVNANAKYLSFMGFAEEQILHADIYDEKCWLHKDIIIENFEKILKGAEASQFEFTEKRTFSLLLDDDDDDTTSEIFSFTLIGKCYPILDSDNTITSIVFNFIDISESKQLINALQATNALNSVITKNFPNGILIVLDKDMNVLLYEGAHETENLRMEDIKVFYRNINDIEAPIFNTIKPHLAEVIDMKMDNNFDFNIEIVDEYGDTVEFHYETFITPVLSANNEIEYIFIYLNNISNRKQLEKAILEFNINLENEVVARTTELRETTQDLEVYVNELQTTQKELEVTKAELAKNLLQEIEINQMKSHFINLMSHEFRTPLTIIQTYVYLMETYYDLQLKDKFDQSLHKVISAIEMMTKLLDNILFLDNIKDKTAHFTSVEIITLIKTVVEEVSDTLKAKQNIIFDDNIDEIVIPTDERLLKEVINNILTNAIKYSPKNSDILIGIENKETELILTITDFGPGIADDIIDRVFDTFVRSASVTSVSGVGLGLSIVKSCVNLLNGDVTFETEKNKGTKFIVTLPKLSICSTQSAC